MDTLENVLRVYQKSISSRRYLLNPAQYLQLYNKLQILIDIGYQIEDLWQAREDMIVREISEVFWNYNNQGQKVNGDYSLMFMKRERTH